MRELNNTKIIGLDEGYGIIKTANTVTSTDITAYDTEPIFSGSILEYGGRYYRIGERSKRDCKPFREYLMQNPQINFRFNKTDYHINFVGCSIYPQGYPASPF